MQDFHYYSEYVNYFCPPNNVLEAIDKKQVQ
jgi:hypothetical protein